ncbi:MAG: hypothetical protein QNI99_21290 [Woeseiaceae bacterium]|nr:hypothetical protein [Woeseiaceae bacterium]
MPIARSVAVTRIRLKGFEQPDTRSQFEGWLEPGRYLVEEYRQDHPDGRTDYARLQAPTLGAGDTWICTRWGEQVYATIEDREQPATVREGFDADDGSILESALLERLSAFHPFRYERDNARYPYPIDGVSLPMAPPNTNNCCTFVEALLAKAWADEHTDFEWNAHRHRQMMITSSDDFFSPVTAAVESGMAVAVADPDSKPHPWTIVQGWRHQWRGGHTFLIVDHHEPSDSVLTLESNSAFKLDGVGFRGIGNLEDVGGSPPDDWWTVDTVWTWDRICSTYRFRQQARLRVRDRSWSGMESDDAAASS